MHIHVLSLACCCPWIPVSPVGGTGACKPPRRGTTAVTGTQPRGPLCPWSSSSCCTQSPVHTRADTTGCPRGGFPSCDGLGSGDQSLSSHPNKEALWSGCTSRLRCSPPMSFQSGGTGTKPLVHGWGGTWSLGVQHAHFHKDPVEYLL